jgi:hypothetical protein
LPTIAEIVTQAISDAPAHHARKTNLAEKISRNVNRRVVRPT